MTTPSHLAASPLLTTLALVALLGGAGRAAAQNSGASAGTTEGAHAAAGLGAPAPASGASPAHSDSAAAHSDSSPAHPDTGSTHTGASAAHAGTAPAHAAATASASPAPAAHDEEGCEDPAPVFDPSTPRLELQVSGGYAVLFHTWRQSSDNFMAPGAHADGLYHGPVLRGEAAFAMGSLSLAAIYTHLWLAHDGTSDPVQMGLVSGELGLQCACRGSTYVWSFGLEGGADVLNSAHTTVFASIEHRSMFYVWEGLFLGFDVDFAMFVGLGSGGASGGGFIANGFLGYSLG